MRLPEPVAGVRWRAGALDDVDLLTAVMAAADRVDEPLDVTTPARIAQMLASGEPDRDVVVGERDGRAVAMGVLFRPGDGPVRLRGAVIPEARGDGIGRVLLRNQIDRAPEVHPDATAVSLRTIEDGGVTGLARRFGFLPARTFLEMSRDLTRPIPDVALAAGLRETELDRALDEPVRLAKNDAFRDHWQGIEESPEQWRARQLGPELVRSLCRVAVDPDGSIGGFVVVHRDDDRPGRVHIPLVGTARAHRGRGVASALLASAMRAAVEAGCTEAELGVDAENPTGAVGVYRRLGFDAFERSTVWQRPLR